MITKNRVALLVAIIVLVGLVYSLSKGSIPPQVATTVVPPPTSAYAETTRFGPLPYPFLKERALAIADLAIKYQALEEVADRARGIENATLLSSVRQEQKVILDRMKEISDLVIDELVPQMARDRMLTVGSMPFLR